MTLLVIEDNPDILKNIADYLEMQGFMVDCAQDGLTALHLISTHSYELIVLDLMLPGVGGLEIAHRARNDMDLPTPILMLTARDTLEDKLQGFARGADDYLVKPFALSELVARIRAILARSQGHHQRQLKVGDLVLDRDKHEVHRAGQPIKLNRTTFRILELLMQESPRLVTRNQLEATIWGDTPPDSDALRSHIHQLRTAIDKPFAHKLLHTRHGVGYVLK